MFEYCNPYVYILFVCAIGFAKYKSAAAAWIACLRCRLNSLHACCKMLPCRFKWFTFFRSGAMYFINKTNHEVSILSYWDTRRITLFYCFRFDHVNQEKVLIFSRSSEQNCVSWKAHFPIYCINVNWEYTLSRSQTLDRIYLKTRIVYVYSNVVHITSGSRFNAYVWLNPL